LLATLYRGTILIAGHHSPGALPFVKTPLFEGLIYDTDGNRYTPSHAVKNGKRYRYYTSLRVIKDAEDASTMPGGCRLRTRSVRCRPNKMSIIVRIEADFSPLQKLRTNPQDLNLYTYTINNPLRYNDPDGEDWKEAVKTAISAITVEIHSGIGIGIEKKVAGTGVKLELEFKGTIKVNTRNKV